MNLSKYIIIMIVLFLPITSSCSGLTAKKWVDSENNYYSENYPPLKISISKDFTYTPDHPTNNEHNAELFIKKGTRESIFIKNYTGEYDPAYTFFSNRMYEEYEKNIGGIHFHVGTEIKKDEGQYFLKEVYIHYPDLRNMFVLMQTMPLSEYHNNHDWSSEFKNYTNRQKEIINDFKKKKAEEIEIEKYIFKEPRQSSSGNNTDERLQKLSDLFKKGLITEEEYKNKKQEILEDI